ncbi:TPA: hypothetical protein N0F65_006133 [Lagenidium giganteum]|uniref:Mitochondrial protein n=1 Tax=Lagenidium giganteum TaxID=4803 RepID=A0AAV2Z6G4_9STRA|nr:TPA: hypothetical protein N0F65_006133 [Lagenidium giganteum]
MMMRSQVLRSALNACQRPAAQQVVARTFASAGANAPVRSAREWEQDIKEHAKRDYLIKRTKLSSMLKSVKTVEELEATKEIMKIYEQKRVDPDANAAGEFVKKALELNAANVAFDVFEANYRIGLFLEPSSLNKLMTKFLQAGDFEKVAQLYEIGTKKYKVRSTERTYDILVRSAIEQQDLDQAMTYLKDAAVSQKLQRVTCNNLLFKLKEQELQDKIDEVAALMKDAGVEPNATTKQILQ